MSQTMVGSHAHLIDQSLNKNSNLVKVMDQKLQNNRSIAK